MVWNIENTFFLVSLHSTMFYLLWKALILVNVCLCFHMTFSCSSMDGWMDGRILLTILLPWLLCFRIYLFLKIHVFVLYGYFLFKKGLNMRTFVDCFYLHKGYETRFITWGSCAAQKTFYYLQILHWYAETEAQLIQ